MNEVDAVGVHKVWESRRATDAGDNADFFVRNAGLLDNIEEGRENSEVSASGTPGWVVGLELLLGELLSWSGGSGIRHGSKMERVKLLRSGLQRR